MDPITTSAIIGAVSTGAQVGGGLFSARKNRKFQESENRRAEDFAREMYQRQVDENVRFWQMQNEYNSPEMQMARLQNAGLNPNLVYGTGATAMGSNITAPASSGNVPRQAGKYADLGSIAQQAFGTKLLQAQIRREEAEADKSEAEASITRVDEKLKEISYSFEEEALLDAYQRSSARDKKEVLEFEEWFQAMFHDNVDRDENTVMKFIGNRDARAVFTHPNSMIRKALSADVGKVIHQVENLKADAINKEKDGKLKDAELSLKELEKVIKGFEVELGKKGFHRNSLQWVTLLSSVIGMALGFTPLGRAARAGRGVKTIRNIRLPQPIHGIPRSNRFGK